MMQLSTFDKDEEVIFARMISECHICSYSTKGRKFLGFHHAYTSLQKRTLYLGGSTTFRKEAEEIVAWALYQLAICDETDKGYQCLRRNTNFLFICWYFTASAAYPGLYSPTREEHSTTTRVWEAAVGKWNKGKKGGRGGGAHAFQVAGGKNFFFFFMVNFIDRLLIEQRIHNYFTDRVMSNANDRAAISNCSIMFLKRFYRLSKT